MAGFLGGWRAGSNRKPKVMRTNRRAKEQKRSPSHFLTTWETEWPGGVLYSAAAVDCEWGTSREAIRQVRVKLEATPSENIQRETQGEGQTTRKTLRREANMHMLHNYLLQRIMNWYCWSFNWLFSKILLWNHVFCMLGLMNFLYWHIIVMRLRYCKYIIWSFANM